MWGLRAYLGCVWAIKGHNEIALALFEQPKARHNVNNRMTNVMQPNTDPVYLESQGLSKTFPKRFWDKVDKTSSPNGCWLWTGATTIYGHGKIQRGVSPHRPIRAHVAAWILEVGPIPKGMNVLHNCPHKHDQRCVNTQHLKLGTHTDNMRDMVLNGTCYLKNTPRKKGHESIHSVLTKEQREQILAEYQGKRGQQSQLARKYGVTQGTIWNVVNHVVCGVPHAIKQT